MMKTMSASVAILGLLVGSALVSGHGTKVTRAPRRNKPLRSKPKLARHRVLSTLHKNLIEVLLARLPASNLPLPATSNIPSTVANTCISAVLAANRNLTKIRSGA
jgi:hypothetical protein